MIRDFFTAEGKGIAPARWHYSSRGGYPKPPLTVRSHGHRTKETAGHGGMTDFDKILPRLVWKVKWKCPIKRTDSVYSSVSGSGGHPCSFHAMNMAV